MSASISPFIAMQPSRRISSGWLLISCGRRIILSRKRDMSALTDAAARSLKSFRFARSLRCSRSLSSSSVPGAGMLTSFDL